MDEPLEVNQRIWQVIAAVPPGKVASYGQIAELAGLGRGARQVARALRYLPSGTQIPWHRIINAQGRIAIPASSSGHQLQQDRLEAEGVEFNVSGRIDLKRFRWQS